jgi:small subunit ribosomal protein S8e
MTTWHLRSKRKKTGGKYIKSRKKKKHELGGEFAATKIGEKKLKIQKARGGNKKLKLLATKKINVVQKGGKIISAEILSVVDNKANPHFIRRNIITKGAIVKTNIGLVKVTSRPGQHGVVNGVLIEEKAEK